MAHETLLSDINLMTGIVLSIQYHPHVDSIREWAREWQEQHLNGERPFFTSAELETMRSTDKYLNTLIHHLDRQQQQLTLDIA